MKSPAQLQSLFGKHHHMVCITVNMLVTSLWCQKQLPLHGNIPAADQTTMILRHAVNAALHLCCFHIKTSLTHTLCTISLIATILPSFRTAIFMLFELTAL